MTLTRNCSSKEVRPFLVHDLLKLRIPAPAEDAPDWVQESINQAPFAVVRRALYDAGKIPVGIRGRTRDQRHPLWLEPSAVVATIRPEHLLHVALPARSTPIPALELVERLKTIFVERGLDWGPVGSVGFELASGVPTATASSDLDIVVRGDKRLNVEQARELDFTIHEQARHVGCRIDALIEVQGGAVSLTEYATRAVVMLRTSSGPRLTSDPWQPPIDG